MYPLIEFHILQSFPVACLNRDDTNSPKTAIVGGVTRLRVSSQCWKRAVREELHRQGVELGIRTKKVEEQLHKVILGRTNDEVKAAYAGVIVKELTDDTLTFLTKGEYEALADYAETVAYDPAKAKEFKKFFKKLAATPYSGLDIALFGRMLAKAPEMNVEAACAFSHAITTHKAASEMDFFSALDDEIGEGATGGAHLGVSEFGSGTYYRYVSLDVEELVKTLGLEKPEDVDFAVGAFVKALYLAVPAARQATMSAMNYWDFARIVIRRGVRLQCTFDRPVRPDRAGGYLEASRAAMIEQLERKEKQAGTLFGKIAQIDFGDTDMSIDDLVSTIQEKIHE